MRAGEALLVGARRTLAEAEGAVLAAKCTAAGELGVVRIAYSWSTRFETLPALGRALMHDRPDVELVSEEMRTYLMPAALRMGTIDVALALYPDIVGEFTHETIRAEHMVAVLSAPSPRRAGDGPTQGARRGSRVVPRRLPSLAYARECAGGNDSCASDEAVQVAGKHRGLTGFRG